jgi:prevent-host-death family protein
METVSVRDLRNSGGEVLTRVEHGETLVVTRDGRPVAELRPLARRSSSAAELIARRRHLPAVDPHRWLADIDDLIDPGL